MSGSVSLINGHIDPDKNRLTDKEIIKALEYCGNVITSTCKGCPYHITHNANCVKALMHDALDLINRQQAEIERLTINMNAFGLGMKQEKERADTIKAEAIKEFWSRLQGIAYQSSDWSHGEHSMVVELDDAEEIYEEMVGEDK